MSNEAVVTVEGNVGGDPEIRFLPDGKAVASFSVANTPSRFNKQTDEWVDGETIWFRVSVFGKKAETVTETIRKGMRVTVFGLLTVSRYTKKDGGAAESLEIAANSIGIVPKAVSSGKAQQDGSDPWSN